MTNGINILRSALKLHRENSSVTAANIANEKVEGYTKKTLQVETLSHAGEPGGVKSSGVMRYVDERLLKTMESQKAVVAALQERVECQENIQSFFGIKGQEAAFLHTLNSIANSLNSLTADPSSTRKGNCVNAMNRLSQQVQYMGNQIQEMRTTVDRKLSNAVNETNQIIERLRQINIEIPQTDETDPEMLHYLDERENLLNELSKNMDLGYTRDGNSLYLATNGYRTTLLHKDVKFDVTYNALVNANPLLSFNPIEVNGVDITNQLEKGRIKELHTLGNELLPEFQAELDELAYQLREQFNILHAEGASVKAPQTLTSFDRLPSKTALPAVTSTGTTAIIGDGVIRIGIIDHNTGDYAQDTPVTQRFVGDLDLTTLGATTVTGLAAAINALLANNTAATDAGIQATVNANGTLSLTKKAAAPGQPDAYGIVLGSVDGQNPPQMHLGAGPFVAADAFNFQHFFGFNRVFQTSDSVEGDSIVGIAQRLQVRSDIITNPEYFAPGKLKTEAVPNIVVGGQPHVAVAASDESVSKGLQDLLLNQTVPFNAAGSIPALTTGFLDYANRMITSASHSVKSNKDRLEKEEQIYTALSQRAHELSGVDPLDELMEMLKISSAQSLTTSALKMINQMDSELYKI